MKNKYLRGTFALIPRIEKKVCPISKRAQTTIFIIIAVVIVAVALFIFLLTKPSTQGPELPLSVAPVYESFLSCLEEDALLGIDLLETRGGFIELPDFDSGSSFMPFSSQLNFAGVDIPYWYYVSGNNIQKEQVPSKTRMQNELAEFVKNKIEDCDLSGYSEQGFDITRGIPRARTVISDDKVEIVLEMELSLVRGEDSAMVREHSILIDSYLGSLYDSAREIYNKEQKELFLEEYAVDTLRLYAPVDGVEVTCSPMIWNAEEVFDDLENAIEANTIMLQAEGEDDDYFNLDLGIDNDVRFLNFKSWAHGFEVVPSEGPILMAMPVGNQQGLGILGFCYVPYHFVYNVNYPVLVQVYNGDEIFQFPMAVVIQRNNPREALKTSTIDIEIPELCQHKNTNINVRTYDFFKRPVEADISYECSNTNCYIGTTNGGRLSDDFPQCVNGYILARAEGYEDGKSANLGVNPGDVNIFLNRLYPLEVDLTLDGKSFGGEAIISFVSETNSKTIAYPEQKTVELSQGEYEVQVSIYRESSLKLESTIKEQCVDVPRSGVLGLFGLTREECFNIEIPEQLVTNALAGGGKQPYYVLENELKNSRVVKINAQSLPVPSSVEQLQLNYVLFEGRDLEVVFE